VAEPLTPQDLLTTAVDVVGADRTKTRALLREVRQRAEERARERLEALLLGKAPEPPRPKSAAAPQAVPRLAPDSPLEIRLQNGRKLRATFTPAVARRDDLAALGRVSAANDRRALAAVKQQSDALEALKRSHEELSEKFTALQEQADRALIALVEGLAGFKEQLRAVKVQEQTVRAERLSVRRLATRQQRQLRSLATTSRIQQVTGVVNSMQAAAYGQKGSVFATNNLLLAGNQLLWTFIDPLLRQLGIVAGTSPSLATWLTPLGSLVTGHLALGNRQHVRFVSGVATFDGTTLVVLEPLRDRIASALWPEFQRRTDVPVTVVPLANKMGDVTATVQNGILRIDVSFHGAGFPKGRVAWMVDTGADVG
jgi:hypothetical protein